MSMTSLSQFPLLNHQTRKVQNSRLEAAEKVVESEGEAGQKRAGECVSRVENTVSIGAVNVNFVCVGGN